jgi:hypothetical protein
MAAVHPRALATGALQKEEELIGFITVVESVYSAVRTDTLYKVDYVSSFKG